MTLGTTPDTRSDTRTMTKTKPQKPTPDYPLFPHDNGRWTKKIKGKTTYWGPWADPDGALQRYLASQDSKIPAKPATNKGAKPAKPNGSPLFPHDCGQWAAKIGGHTRYFGPWADHAAALKRYQNRDADTGRAVRSARLNLVTLVNKFLNRCDRKVATGELTLPLREAYDTVCQWTMRVLKKRGLVENLGPDDFAKLKRAFAKGQRGSGVGAVTLTNYITHARCLFNYSAKVLKVPVNDGDEFSPANRKTLRRERRVRPKKFFEAAEIHRLLNAAPLQMKAMILLGCNAGFGNSDCARLTTDHLDLEGGWAVFPRPKTEVDRRAKLWPETIEAIKAAMAAKLNCYIPPAPPSGHFLKPGHRVKLSYHSDLRRPPGPWQGPQEPHRSVFGSLRRAWAYICGKSNWEALFRHAPAGATGLETSKVLSKWTHRNRFPSC